MSFNQSELFKTTISTLDRTELDIDFVKDLLIKLHDSCDRFQFHFQLNDILKKAFQYKRIETVKNIIESLCTLSLQINFDPAQVQWLDSFKFLSQLSNLDTCIDPVLKMLDKKIYLPEATMNFIVENLIETRHYDQSLYILKKLKDHARIGKLKNRSILKNYLIYDQSKVAFQFLELLPLDDTATFYVWEDYIQYCCNKDKTLEAKESLKSFFTRIMPAHVTEAETIYSCFLSYLCKCDAIRETLSGTIDDFVELKLKVKPSVLKDSLLKLLDEKMSQKEFYLKVDLVKFNLEAREFSALLSRLIQLRRKIEVLALIDMIVSENEFTFKLSDLNLSNQDMKYIMTSQSATIKHLLIEVEKSEAADDARSMMSDHTSILDRLTFDEQSNLDDSFERITN